MRCIACRTCAQPGASSSRRTRSPPRSHVRAHATRARPVAQWFQYVCGNIVGLGTPLTTYSPNSGHWVAEVFDLLIAAWSMTFAGLVFGLVGALGFVSLTTELMDRGVTSRVNLLVTLRNRIRALAEDSSGLDLEEFFDEARAFPKPLPEDRLRALFNDVDAERTGTIRKLQVPELMAKLEAAMAESAADLKLKELVAAVARLSEQVQALRETVGASS